MEEPYDFLIIGSGFGGSVSALRLTEKGYRVLVLERGKRFRDQDFAARNWFVWKYLWLPAVRCFGILQISPFKDVFVLHGSGVGGGSLGYGNIIMQPDDAAFDTPAWKKPVLWKDILAPHYQTACRMLGAVQNPRLWKADEILQEIAAELGREDTFRPTEGAVYFGEPGVEVPDPFFGGEGPPRKGCIQCGACMVGCRHNSKNTLVKNYLYFAEKWGAQVWSECEVVDVVPLPEGQTDGARYEVLYKSSTALLLKKVRTVRTKNVVFSAGALGTMKLLFRCRDITRSLPRISPRLGYMVRTNSESLMGVSSRDTETDYSEGIAITSMFHADGTTTVEPVRYPAGSSLMRFLAIPLIEGRGGMVSRIIRTAFQFIKRPKDYLITHILPGWARRTTILLVMQTEDNRFRIRMGRSFFTGFRKNLVSLPDEEATIPSRLAVAHYVTKRFSEMSGGIPAGSITEGLFEIPFTAHILGGCPMGSNSKEAVIDERGRIHEYPGLYVADGSIVPANPGINPSLTITAMAEYVCSEIEPKEGAQVRTPLGIGSSDPEKAKHFT
jgi:cholesterol oxidase